MAARRRQQQQYPVELMMAQDGEGIGDFFRSIGRTARNVNRGLKKARVVGRTDDFLAKTGFRDPVRNLIAQNVPYGNRVLQGADLAKKHGYGARGGANQDLVRHAGVAQHGDGIIGSLLTGAASMIPGVGPIVSPLVGEVTSSLGLGKRRRKKPGPKKGSGGTKKKATTGGCKSGGRKTTRKRKPGRPRKRK